MGMCSVLNVDGAIAPREQKEQKEQKEEKNRELCENRLQVGDGRILLADILYTHRFEDLL